MKDYLMRLIDLEDQDAKNRLTLTHYTKELVKHTKMGNKNVVERYERLIQEMID